MRSCDILLQDYELFSSNKTRKRTPRVKEK